MSGLVWEEKPVLLDPVAVIAFEGWGDAGASASGVTDYLLDQLAGFRFAYLDSEEYFDFQATRPMVELDETGTRVIEWPDTEFHAVSAPDRDLVVVTGVEPHTRWKTFCGKLVDVLRSVGVRTVITLGAFIGEVPHSLPVPLIGIGSRPELLDRYGLAMSGYEGPTGIVGVLNTILAEADLTVVSVWAAVPHYLTSHEYPPGTLALLDKVAEIARFGVDRSELVELSADFRREIDDAIADPEMKSYVSELENQVLAEEVGSGDDLLDEIERFLRDT